MSGIAVPRPRDIGAETMADLRRRILGGADPARLYILATAPVLLRGAEQVIRGPVEPDGNWRACFWRADASGPGGWPVRLRVCTKKTLPRWARKAMRGAGRVVLASCPAVTG